MKSSYKYERDYTFGNALLTLRTHMGLTQAELAERVQVSEQSVIHWEGGRSYPKTPRLKLLIELGMQLHAFPAGREREEIEALWKAARQRVLLDEDWLQAMLNARRSPSGNREVSGAPALLASVPPPIVAQLPSPRIDWVGALDVSRFYGREVEIAELSKWVLQEHCRVIVLLGMGGIGKSTLVSLLGQRLAPHFEAVLWYSVRDAPTCEELLATCSAFFSEMLPSELPTSLEQRINQLIRLLQAKRCLLALDNLETLLQGGDREGGYLPGYEGYGRLIQRLAETAHQSCILLTSREKPREIEHIEGPRASVRTLRLTGLAEPDARALLEDKGLRGASSDWLTLISTYTGNPLALKIVAQVIVDLFEGQINQFLSSGELYFHGIRAILQQQVARLTPLERAMLNWLSVVREWTSLDSLLSMLIPRPIRKQALEALEALRRRSLIEAGQQGRFTSQSVIMEYVSETLADTLGAEIGAGRPDQLRLYALEQARARDYVRQSQIRLLVQPLLERLRSELGSDQQVEKQLRKMLDQFRVEDGEQQGYGPANIISLLKVLRGNLNGLDFADLSLREAYFQGVQMQGASLARARLHEPIFTEAFDAVLSVAISPDSAYWAAGSNNGSVRVWRDEGFSAHLVLHAHSNRVGSLAFSPDSRSFATASWDGTVKLWELASGSAIWTAHARPTAVTTIAFQPGGSLLASAGYDGRIQLLDARSGLHIRELIAHAEPVLALAWSHDGYTLVSAGNDNTIRFWDIEQGEERFRLIGHSAAVTCLAFAPDGTTLASGSYDQTIKLWEIETGVCHTTLDEHTGVVTGIAWRSDGQVLASTSYDTTIRLWRPASVTMEQVLQGHSDVVNALNFTPDGNTLLSVSSDQTVRVWETLSGQCLRILQGYALSWLAVDWSPDGRFLLSGSSDATITQWNVADWSPAQVLRGHSQMVRALACSPDGNWYASGSPDKTIRIWDAASGRCVRVLQGHTDLISSVAWSPDAKYLASSSYDQTVRMWDLSDGTPLWIGREHAGLVYGVAWSADGKLLASCSEQDQLALIWQAEDGRLVQRYQHEHPLYGIAWSREGDTLIISTISGHKGELLLWNIKSGQHSVEPTGHDGFVLSVAVYPQKDMLVSGGADGAIRWREIAQKRTITTFHAHDGWVRCIRINPAGTLIASAGEDGALIVWDAQSRKMLVTLRSPRPYEGLAITGIKGITEAQKATLRALGAIEHENS